MKMNEKAEIGIATALGTIFVLIVFGAIILGLSTVIVPAGHVGVYDLFGEVSDKEFYPGFHWKNPLAHIEIMSIQTQQYEYKEIKGTLTKEGLEVVPDASVIWHIDSDKASDIYKTIHGNYFETLVTPNFMGLTRDEIKRWSAEDIYTGVSTKIQDDVYVRLAKNLENRGIVIETVLFRGLMLPAQVTTAIEMKIKEKQAVEQMKFTVDKQKLEAERLVIEATAIAQSNAIKSKSLTSELIQWEFVQAIKENKNVIYVPIGGSGTGTSIIISPKNQ